MDKISPVLQRNKIVKLRGKCGAMTLSLRGLMIVMLSLFIFSACGNKKAREVANKPQPTLDSTYYIEYMTSDPRMKDHVIWAKNFYRERGFKLGWFKNNEIVPQAEKVLDIVSRAGEEGLDPANYQLRDFDKLFSELDAAKKDSAKFTALQKEIDVALSATYFAWASDYYRGMVVPRENEEIEWDVKRNKIKLHKALMTVLGERESKYPYATFSPLHPAYANLKKALANYRKVKSDGGWPKIPAAKLKPGQASPVVPLLRTRLGLQAADSVYSAEVENAVKQFQTQVGLKPDGALGAETVKELNVSVDERIRQIILNMERWRWIPKSFEPDYLIVNIPEYRLRVVEKGKEVMAMNVIVGKTMHSTPIFSDKMEYVVLSPYWNVPVSIIKNEIGPKAAGNPGYLNALDMEVVTGNGSPVDPSSIDWGSVDESNWKYVLRRRPGPKNDLGDVKFIFPNTDDIYLHDTPNDQLFNETQRNFSHGCVRVEKPIELATYLLRNVGWDRNKIENTIAQRKEKHVKLKTVLPVYLVYFTAWADENGRVSFREDIYGHDKTLSSEYFAKL